LLLLPLLLLQGLLLQRCLLHPCQYNFEVSILLHMRMQQLG
jgi:hypothetical protein